MVETPALDVRGVIEDKFFGGLGPGLGMGRGREEDGRKKRKKEQGHEERPGLWGTKGIHGVFSVKKEEKFMGRARLRCLRERIMGAGR
jgi:hypothetical protein